MFHVTLVQNFYQKRNTATSLNACAGTAASLTPVSVIVRRGWMARCSLIHHSPLTLLSLMHSSPSSWLQTCEPTHPSRQNSFSHFRFRLNGSQMRRVSWGKHLDTSAAHTLDVSHACALSSFPFDSFFYSLLSERPARHRHFSSSDRAGCSTVGSKATSLPPDKGASMIKVSH